MVECVRLARFFLQVVAQILQVGLRLRFSLSFLSLLLLSRASTRSSSSRSGRSSSPPRVPGRRLLPPLAPARPRVPLELVVAAQQRRRDRDERLVRPCSRPRSRSSSAGCRPLLLGRRRRRGRRGRGAAALRGHHDRAGGARDGAGSGQGGGRGQGHVNIVWGHRHVYLWRDLCLRNPRGREGPAAAPPTPGPRL